MALEMVYQRPEVEDVEIDHIMVMAMPTGPQQTHQYVLSLVCQYKYSPHHG